MQGCSAPSRKSPQVALDRSCDVVSSLLEHGQLLRHPELGEDERASPVGGLVAVATDAVRVNVRMRRILRDLSHIRLLAAPTASSSAVDTSLIKGPSFAASASASSATEVMCRRTTSTGQPSIDVPYAWTTSQPRRPKAGDPTVGPCPCRDMVRCGTDLRHGDPADLRRGPRRGGWSMDSAPLYHPQDRTWSYTRVDGPRPGVPHRDQAHGRPGTRGRRDRRS